MVNFEIKVSAPKHQAEKERIFRFASFSKMRELTEEYFDLEKSNYFDIEEEEEDMENEWISKDQHQQRITTMDQFDFKNGNSPYFGLARKDSSSENVRFVSPPISSSNLSKGTTPKMDRSILNELLPTQVQLESDATNSGCEGKTEFYLLNDKIYGHVFKGCLIVWALWSTYLISSESATSTQNLPEIVTWFVLLLILGLAMTALWAKVLAEQTKSVVYGLMLAVPGGFGVLGLVAFSHWYLASGIVSCSIAAILTAALYFNKSNLRNTVEIVHSAAIFVQATPKIYGLVLKVVAVYVAFTVIWLMAFIRLFNTKNTLMFTLISQSYFIFMLIWFGAVASTAQKFIIATWVRSWMDHIEDTVNDQNQNKSNSLFSADDGTFGSICLAAGLLSLAQITRIAAKSVHFSGKAITKIVPFSWTISAFSSWLVTLISVAERFLQRFTDFSLYYLAISDVNGFVNSCREMSRAVDGHIGLAITTDSTALLLLTFSTALISFSSTALILFLAKSHVSWSSGVLIGILSASVTGFISNVYLSAIDATFLCFLIDVKRPEMIGKIDNEIQSAFSSKLSKV